MLGKAVELAEAHGWFLTRQFDNEANPEIHSRTTAQEILRDFADDRLDYWVTGFGTGGTLKGVARILKQATPATRVVVCEPDNSQMYASDIRHPVPASGVPGASHPRFRPHPVQGWAPDFVPKLAEDARQWVDGIVPVDGLEALRLARELATREGILTGISGGATLAGALVVAARARPGSNILCMLPDTGERYLFTPLFERHRHGDVGGGARDSPRRLRTSASTSRCRRSPPASACAQPVPTSASRDFVATVLADEALPVVMFALSWCEFCWAVRKLFTRCGIAYRAVDLDSVEYQGDDWGGAVRAALIERTAIPTIPQIFVAGELVGNATEVFQSFAQGRLQSLLADRGIPFEDGVGDGLYSLMPGWVQKTGR